MGTTGCRRRAASPLHLPGLPRFAGAAVAEHSVRGGSRYQLARKISACGISRCHAVAVRAHCQPRTGAGMSSWAVSAMQLVLGALLVRWSLRFKGERYRRPPAREPLMNLAALAAGIGMLVWAISRLAS